MPDCPMCGNEMQPEHAHYRCGCGYRDTCCEGAPLCASPPYPVKHTQTAPPATEGAIVSATTPQG